MIFSLWMPSHNLRQQCIKRIRLIFSLTKKEELSFHFKISLTMCKEKFLIIFYRILRFEICSTS